MATWSGWQQQFLNAALLRDTPANRDFLTEWAKHASSPQCARNPIDLHAKVGGSTNCDHPAGFTAWTQAYTSHAHAATAFAHQVNSSQFLAIQNTFGIGNPWEDTGDYQVVHKALLAWPSNLFASYYLNRMSGGSGGPGGGGGKSATAHSGWKHLRHSVNHNMPAALRTSERNTAAALRALSKGRKVRL